MVLRSVLFLALSICAVGCSDDPASLEEQDASFDASDASVVDADSIASDTPADTIDSSTIADTSPDVDDAPETSELDAGDASPEVADDAADVFGDDTLPDTSSTDTATIADSSFTETAADSTVISPSALWFVDDSVAAAAQRLDLPAGTTESFPDLAQTKWIDVSGDASVLVAEANSLYKERDDLFVRDASGSRLLYAGDIGRGPFLGFPTLSRDAKQVAFVDALGTLRVAATAGGPVVAAGKDGARWLHWSSDGRYVAGDGVFDLTTTPPTAITLESSCTTRALAISGASVALYQSTCGTIKEIRRKDLSIAGDVPKSLATLTSDVFESDLSADGKTLLAVAGPALVVDVTGASPASTVVVDGKTDYNALQPRISPDGSRIAFVALSSSSGVIAVGPLGGAMKSVPTSGPVSLRWSPDSRQLAYYEAGYTRLTRIADVTAPMPALERTISLPVGSGGLFQPLAWTSPPPPSSPPADAGGEAAVDAAPPPSPPVGDIFFIGGTIYDTRLLSSTATGPAAPLLPDWVDVYSLSVSAKRIAVVAELDSPYRFAVWTIDRTTGARKRISAISNTLSDVAISPDDSFIAYADGALHIASDTSDRIVGGCGYCLSEHPWSADGKRLAIDGGTHTTIIDAAGIVPNRDVALPSGITDSRFAGFAGTDIVVKTSAGTGQSIVRLHDDGTVVGTIPVPTGASSCISADGTMAAIASTSGLTLQRTDGLGSPTVATSSTSASATCKFSPDGTRIALSGTIEGVGGLFVWSTGTTAAIRVANFGSTVFAWSKASDAIVWTDWDATRKTTSLTIADSPPDVLYTFPYANHGTEIAWR